MPLLAEHFLFRVFTGWKEEHQTSSLANQCADLVEARVGSFLRTGIERAAELGAGDAIRRVAYPELAGPGDNALDAAIRRLSDAAVFVAPGAVARLVSGDGRVLATSAPADGEEFGWLLGRSEIRRRGRSVFAGRQHMGDSDGFLFVANVERSVPSSLTGTLAIQGAQLPAVVLWVPSGPLDRALSEIALGQSNGTRILAMDADGVVVADTGTTQLLRKFERPNQQEIEALQASSRFGETAASLLRSAPSDSRLLKLLFELDPAGGAVRVRSPESLKCNILCIVKPEGAGVFPRAEDILAFTLALVFGAGVFFLVYSRSRDSGNRVDSSVAIPATAGAFVFIVILLATIYATRVIDSSGRKSADSLSAIIEKSLVSEIETRVSTRLAYFSQLDDRIAAAHDVQAEFTEMTRPCSQAFPDGLLILWTNDRDPAAPKVFSRDADPRVPRGSARLPAGRETLAEPAISILSNHGGEPVLVLDGPFRSRSGSHYGRLQWNFELAEFCNTAFAAARTGGFDVALVRASDPTRAIYPRGLSVAPGSVGSSVIRIAGAGENGNGSFKLALTPRVDLFGVQTQRATVFYVGLILSFAGGITASIVVGALGSYRRASRIDALTGLYNRIEFDEMLQREVARAHRHSRTLTLALIDLDHFKQVNDTHGHAVGDDVLRRVAAELEKLVRKTDTVFRHGGEEFAVLLPETPEDAALIVIERVREHFANKEIVEKLGTITFSCGVAAWDGAETTDTLLARADAALYQAKSHGRNRVLSASVLKMADSLRAWPAVG